MSANSPDSLANMDAAVQRLVQLYETLTQADIRLLGTCYAPDAHFKDPFNDVSGVPAITRIFEHMFDALLDPRFVVTQKLVQGQQAFLAWEFHFRLRSWRPDTAQCINGATWLTLDAQGRVSMHRDYWDTAEELYAKLPLLGSLMRWLRKAGSASGKTIDADRSPP